MISVPYPLNTRQESKYPVVKTISSLTRSDGDTSDAFQSYVSYVHVRKAWKVAIRVNAL